MRHRKWGVTLIEVLMVGLISLIVAAGVFAVIQTAYNSQNVVITQSAANSNARVAIDDMMDRVRGAQLNAGAGPITIAAAREIRFYDYYDQYDRAQAHTLMTIRYWLNGTTLTRSVLDGGGNAVFQSNVASGVQSLQLYYQLTGSTTWETSEGSPGSVNAVSCTATAADNGATRQITGTVQVRAKH